MNIAQDPVRLQPSALFGDLVGTHVIGRQDHPDLGASPLSEEIDRLVSNGYLSLLRPCAPAGATCSFRDRQTNEIVDKIADGKIPSQFKNGRWFGLPDWRNLAPNMRDVDGWRQYPGAGLCLVTGSVGAFDIDIKIAPTEASPEADRGRQLVAEVNRIVAGVLGVPVERLSRRWRENSTSSLVFVALPEPIGKRKLQFVDQATGCEHAIEFMAAGQQVVITGLHKSGARLRSSLIDTPISELPPLSAADLDRGIAAITSAAARIGFDLKSSKAPVARDHDLPVSFETAVLREVMSRRAEWASAVVPCIPGDYHEWRVSSAELDRELEEDLSIYSDGIFDHGTERGHTPTSLICEFGNLDESGEISFGGSPIYGRSGDEPFAVVGEPDPAVLRPNEASALTWLCNTLAGESPPFPANATWAGSIQEIANSVGVSWGEHEQHRQNKLAATYFEDLTEVEPLFGPEPSSAVPDVFKTLRLDQLLDLPDPKFVVARHLPERSLGFLFGAPGAKKSFLALDWAMHLAFGKTSWHGDDIIAKPAGVVLYLAGEGAHGMKARAEAWMQHHQIPLDQRSAGRFHLLPHSVDLMKPEQVKKLAATLRLRIAQPIVAVVVDTVSRSMPGADENLQKDMTLFVGACDAIKSEFDCLVLGVHHASKSGDMRGSTVLLGAGDFVFRMECKQGHLAGKLHCEKQKDAPDGWSEPYRFEVVHLGDGRSSLVPTRASEINGDVSHERIALILDAMQAAWDTRKPWAKSSKAGERCAVRRLAVDFGINADQAETLITFLERTGDIVFDVADAKSKLRGFRVVARNDQGDEDENAFD
ncbi:helicase RepA family protein [Aminobacter sp. NyZ550]|uniref:helicase RepA family protein n=1 Tax=Aminobacter sp. NyZ550 TaxID=2979870 RepID=UPI0021D5E524|nr:helicase RepA family protein [Aminobacter sp. NyZ550]WAX96631.1 helicase RepA family protein [Aminobacter sp. NyZ550]